MREPSTASSEDLPTLDDLFRAAVFRTPQAWALVDPPDRDRFTDGVPRRLTFAKADEVVTAIARRLRDFGLPADSIVAVQLPNIVESVLTLLGVLRAGLIAAPLPLLWRRADMTAALGRIGAKVLIATQRVGSVDHGEIAMRVAAETFAVRFVCGFGDRPSDGVIALDDVFDPPADPREPIAPAERPGAPADHVAVVTFDLTSDGIIPVARSHAELVAAGAAVVSEVGTIPCARIMGALATSSIAGLASQLMPWLITGGTLALHQAFAAHVFAAQRMAEGSTLTVVPGPLVPSLCDARLLDAIVGPAAVLAVWRAPEQLATSAVLSDAVVDIVDLSVFGEIGLIASRRAGGRPEAPALEPTVPVWQEMATASGVGATRTAGGTLALRGSVVPRHPFPPGIDRADPLRLKIDENGFVDTFYPCRRDREIGRLIVTGPPAGLVNVGGYRFSLRDLEATIERIDREGSVVALPDRLSGHRLAGLATDREAVRRALDAQGANPLLVGAFRERRPTEVERNSDDASAA